MAHAAKSTTDHETIKQWAESKGGHPAAVKGSGKGTDPGIIRIDFPGFSGEQTLVPISWDDFFRAFDAADLALLYREEDRFNKLVGRDTVAARGRGERRSRRDEERNLAPRERASRVRARVEQQREAMERGASTGRSRKSEPAKASASTTARAASATGRASSASRTRSAPGASRASARSTRAAARSERSASTRSTGASSSKTRKQTRSRSK